MTESTLNQGSAEARAAYSRDEFARRLGVSRDSITRAIARKKIKAVRFGRRVLIPASELERVLREAR